jgi:hypothetical protein
VNFNQLIKKRDYWAFLPPNKMLASFELHPTPSYVVKEMIGRYKAGAKI